MDATPFSRFPCFPVVLAGSTWAVDTSLALVIRPKVLPSPAGSELFCEQVGFSVGDGDRMPDSRGVEGSNAQLLHEG